MKYRSNYEGRFAKAFPTLEFETKRLAYTVPATQHKYTPDFYDPETDTYYELKGRFTARDRKKMLLVTSQHKIRLIMVFQNPNLPINKGSKTTYGDWCTQNGIEWTSW